MARNRKRAKERRARRPQPVASRGREGAARDGLPEQVEPEQEVGAEHEVEAEQEVEELAPEEFPEPLEPSIAEPPEGEAPPPLEHAAPDAEIAEVQMELGALESLEDEQAPAEEAAEPDEFEEPEPDEFGGGSRGGAGRIGGGFDGERGGGGPPSGGGGELALPGGTVAQRRAVPGNRLITFLQGSWRELQRVQWPDRRQVMQATGVVIGFVIVAGVFLGVSDWVAGKLVGFVINGHF